MGKRMKAFHTFGRTQIKAQKKEIQPRETEVDKRFKSIQKEEAGKKQNWKGIYLLHHN